MLHFIVPLWGLNSKLVYCIILYFSSVETTCLGLPGAFRKQNGLQPLRTACCHSNGRNACLLHKRGDEKSPVFHPIISILAP